MPPTKTNKMKVYYAIGGLSPNLIESDEDTFKVIKLTDHNKAVKDIFDDIEKRMKRLSGKKEFSFGDLRYIKQKHTK